MYYLRLITHSVTGRLESSTTHPQMTSEETMVLIGHMTNQDEVWSDELRSAGLHPNVRNIAEHVQGMGTAGEACFA